MHNVQYYNVVVLMVPSEYMMTVKSRSGTYEDALLIAQLSLAPALHRLLSVESQYVPGTYSPRKYPSREKMGGEM